MKRILTDFSTQVNNRRLAAQRLLSDRVWFIVDWLMDLSDDLENLRHVFNIVVNPQPVGDPFADGGALNVPLSPFPSQLRKLNVRTSRYLKKTRDSH